MRRGEEIVFDLYVMRAQNPRVKAAPSRAGGVSGRGINKYTCIYTRRTGRYFFIIVYTYVYTRKWKNNDSDKAKPCLARDGFSFMRRRDARWTSDRVFSRVVRENVYRAPVCTREGPRNCMYIHSVVGVAEKIDRAFQ